MASTQWAISASSAALSTGPACSQSARSRWVEKCSETKRTLRVVWRLASITRSNSMSGCDSSESASARPASSSPTTPTKMQARAERDQVARHVAGAADHQVGALDRDHRGRRLRRDARDVAIDELVEHQIADAEHGLAARSARCLSKSNISGFPSTPPHTPFIPAQAGIQGGIFQQVTACRALGPRFRGDERRSA